MFSETSNDEILIVNLAKGDDSAFRSVYNQYYRKIYQFAFSFTKNREQSEEILQETFLMLWKRRMSLDPSMPIAPVLFTVSRRLVIDSFRKSMSAEKYRIEVTERLDMLHTDTAEKVEFSDLKRVVNDIIAELPQQQQTVLKLKKFDELSYDEISERLNISKSTVKNHLMAALKTLRSRMDREGILYVLLILLAK